MSYIIRVPGISEAWKKKKTKQKLHVACERNR